ncbi:uncharacterized protein LOC110176206 [Drosophila serrata]|uniref:uncharacterized protein LOC110176206 n=1 Tax=Drosophila serrata TaxID=7274 RepID=UPI000A1D3482|nr:uncharacterized protein LOC110176206 [Drosophila serrata]
MERYNRAWRDPGSPLTPLTPLSTQAFTFETTEDSVTPTGPRGSKTCTRTGLFGIPKASHHLQVPGRRPATSAKSLTGSRRQPTRFSQAFMRTRSVFSPSSQSTLYGERSIPVDPKSRTMQESRVKPEVRVKSEFRVKQESSKVKKEDTVRSPIHQRFKHGSPVEHPSLSPRVRSLLNRTGNEHLTELFTRQEIDIEVLIHMTLEDLAALGVRGAREIKVAMQIIQLAKQFF